MTIGIVLSVTPSYSETFFVSKIKGLQNSGYKVILFVQKKEDNFNLCPVVEASKLVRGNTIKQFWLILTTAMRLAVFDFRRIVKFVRLERQIKRSFSHIFKNCYNNAHLLHAKLNWVHFGFSTLAVNSENVAEAINAKMAVSLRGFDMDLSPTKHGNIYNIVWDKVDKVHTLSDYLIKKAYELGLTKNKPVQKIPPAISVNKYQAVVKSLKSPVVLLTIARLHFIKGLTSTIEAMAILRREGREFRYVIIGEGEQYDELVLLIDKLNLKDYIQLVGKVTHEETIKYLEEADIYIQYSISEGFCNAALEAQAMGLACVVSDGGGLPENVINNKTGWVVPKNKPEELAKKLEYVINMDEKERKIIQTNAMERVLDNFNLDLQERKFKEFYTE